jgi:hypothetical protein
MGAERERGGGGREGGTARERAREREGESGKTVWWGIKNRVGSDLQISRTSPQDQNSESAHLLSRLGKRRGEMGMKKTVAPETAAMGKSWEVLRRFDE